MNWDKDNSLVDPSVLLRSVSRLLPWEANAATYRFMGGDKCMLPFIKNVEKRTTNGHVKSS